ncbi:MAG: DnaD domain protein, partial [Clostridia bacterium]|nr:DnaD domain protein [Clostridia bacterium]
MKQEKTEIATPLKVSDGVRGTVPRLAGKIALREASADDLRVLLVFLERGAEPLARAAGVSPARAQAALDYWRDAGILTDGETVPAETAPKKALPADELIPMTGKETAEILRRRDLSGAIDEAQRLLGKTFNTTELRTFAELVEQLQVEPAYVLTLISWCIRRGKGTLYYVRGTAVSLVSEGIETLSQLEDYISRREAAESGVGQLRKMFGIGDRALTKTEEKRFTEWLVDDGLPVEVIGIAYDITVNNTGKVSLAYIDKLIKVWRDAGCAGSAEEVERYVERERAERGQSAVGKAARGPKHDAIPSTYDSGDFFARAVERSYKK